MKLENALILSKVLRGRISFGLASGAGVLFVAAGAFKLFMAVPGGSTLSGPRAFAAFLAQLEVPFPVFFGLAVPLLEIIGGVGLLAKCGVRLWALLLACDMAAAIFLVGAPGKRIGVGANSVGGEAWRLPLEIALLLAMLWLIIFSPQDSKSKKSV